jgi:hypothetical protein
MLSSQRNSPLLEAAVEALAQLEGRANAVGRPLEHDSTEHAIGLTEQRCEGLGKLLGAHVDLELVLIALDGDARARRGRRGVTPQ